MPRRISQALLSALSAGVVPRLGLERIAVGRKAEIEAFLGDMGALAEGGSAFRLICGRYGSGKSFMLQICRGHALESGYATMDADLSPERKLTGQKGQGLATYRALVRSLAIRSKPEGGALQVIIDAWLLGLQSRVMAERGVARGSEAFAAFFEGLVSEACSHMQGVTHGFDVSAVLSRYWKGCVDSDDEAKANCLKWLCGEYALRSAARKDLGVTEIVDDGNWYDFLKVMARLVGLAGQKGLVAFVDEGVNLYKVSNALSRNQNYEKLLSMFNDLTQNAVQGLAMYFGLTPQALEDPRRGLYGYEAFRTRLSAGAFGASLPGVSGPVIRLGALEYEELFVLLRRVLGVYEAHHSLGMGLSDDDLTAFLQASLDKVGAKEGMTPREMLRGFLHLLDVVRQGGAPGFRSAIRAALSVADPARADPDPPWEPTPVGWGGSDGLGGGSGAPSDGPGTDADGLHEMEL